MDVILDRGSTPLTSRKEKGSHGEPFSFLFYKNRSALVQLEKSIFASLSRTQPVNTGRLSLTEVNFKKSF